MTAICPAGPPKLSSATRTHTRNASPKEILRALSANGIAGWLTSVVMLVVWLITFSRCGGLVRGFGSDHCHRDLANRYARLPYVLSRLYIG
jgi:hypothetical protein